MICEIDFPAVDGDRWRARFAHPQRVLLAYSPGEVIEIIAAAEQAARDEHWVVGFVAYEAATAFDTALTTLPASDDLPLAAFAVYGYDEPGLATEISPDMCCGPWAMRDGVTTVAANIESIHAAIDRGDCYQVNYTTRLDATCDAELPVLYAALRAAQPDGYCISIDGGDWQLASVSPELFFDWTADRTLTTRPMKGTASRATATAESLRASAKERAENLMIVDLLRNDMARVAETGSVQVTSLFDVETLPTAYQMTSTIRCTTRQGTILVDVFRALFPCGSVTGAPKIAAMQAIATLESSARGIYCGALGVIRPGGHATFNVAIRTVAIDRQKRLASCGIGSGITFDSTAQDEYAEWLVKRRFLLRATADFALLETLRLEDGKYWLLEQHLQRFTRSAAYFGFVCDADMLRRELAQNAGQRPDGLWRVRLLLARNGQLTLENYVLEDIVHRLTVALAHSPIDSDNEYLCHKTTERTIYSPHQPAADNIFDTLLFNERGEITEFTRGNVVVELDGRCVTPPLACGLLPGVLRSVLLKKRTLFEQVVTRDDLTRATEIWFANSVRGLIPVRLLPVVG